MFLSECSPNFRQDMPTMATLSLMPWDAMSLSPRSEPAVRSVADGAGLPEVVVDAVGRVEPAEGHLDAVADLDLVGLDVGELAGEATAAVEVDDGGHDRRARRVRHAVDRVGDDRGRDVGHGRGLH